MEFRGYRAEDFDTLYALDVACFEPVYRFSRRMLRWSLHAADALVVVAEDGGIAGFVVVHVERGGVGYVVTLDVAPAWRRKGVAASLMARVEAQAKAAGCRAMELHVAVDNVGAVRAYESGGYMKADRAAGFYGQGGDGWIYRKFL